MPRKVRAKREKLQHKKYRGLITQFIIFVLLRSIDLAASISVLAEAGSQSSDWEHLNQTLFNTINNESKNSKHIFTNEHCQDIKQWNTKEIDSTISKYNSVIGGTLFFNLVSFIVFATHFGFWIATLKVSFDDGTEYETRVTRLTRNTLLSLFTAVFRDVPLSCLNIELLALRSGPEGLACIACTFAGKCRQEDYIENSLKTAKHLLRFNYFMMLLNSLWKGVTAFYRFSRFKEFDFFYIRACASVIFGFLYSILIFTPAMFMFIYVYFAIPGLRIHFLYDLASRLAFIGATMWVVFVSVVVCCPILYAIRLNVD